MAFGQDEARAMQWSASSCCWRPDTHGWWTPTSKDSCPHLLEEKRRAVSRSRLDSIPQDQLLALVREKIADSRILALLERFLRQGVMDTARGWEPTENGTPQGAVICQHCQEKVAGCLRFAPAAPCWPTSISTRSTIKWPGRGGR